MYIEENICRLRLSFSFFIEANSMNILRNVRFYFFWHFVKRLDKRCALILFCMFIKGNPMRIWRNLLVEFLWIKSRKGKHSSVTLLSFLTLSFFIEGNSMIIQSYITYKKVDREKHSSLCAPFFFSWLCVSLLKEI